MKIVEKNLGPKIPYTEEGTVLNFGMLSVDCSDYQKSWDVNIDICEDQNGNLAIGTGVKYVAQIEIPKKKYIEENPEPLDMNEVTLSLWRIRNV